MNFTAAPPPPPESAAPLPEGQRIANLFFAPSKTFTDLRRNASWWAPFLILALVSVGFVFVVDKKIGFRKVTENQIQLSARDTRQIEQLPPDQRDRQIETRTKATGYIAYSFSIFILITYLVIAAVLLATFKFGAGADLTFKATLAVVMYSALPDAIKSILAIISVLAGVSADSFTFQNPVATNPGYFLNPADSRFLYSICTALDVFRIWTLVLTGIGLSCVSKLKRSTAVAGVFAWYVLLVLVGAALGSLSS